VIAADGVGRCILFSSPLCSADPVASGEFLPVHLHGVQELNYMVGDFFDRALYYLARGYEAEAQVARSAVVR
jgi:hypothetical protein